jgi:hypothetical protein
MRLDLRLLVACAALTACSSAPTTTAATATTDPVAAITPGPESVSAGPCLTPFSFEVSSGVLQPAFSPDVHDYELTSFTTLVPVSVVVHGANAGLNGEIVRAEQPYPVAFDEIAPSSTLALDLCGATYNVHLLPSDFPTYTVKADGPTPGHMFLAPFSWSSKTLPSFLMITNEVGGVLYYLRVAAQAYDFKKHILTNGDTRYSFISNGVVTILDEKFRPLAEHVVQATGSHAAFAVDVHDFQMFEDDHFIVTAYVDKIVNNVPPQLPHPVTGARVQAAFVQEVRAGQVVLEWDSTDHPELYALSTDGHDFSTIAASADYAHLNAVIVDRSDGNLLLSFRHLDAILKVRRTDGAILWRLGGPNDTFGTTPEQKTSHQHFPVLLPDGRLQVFDNGNATMATRIVTYRLDEDAHEVDSFDAYPIGSYTWAMGSVEAVGTSSLFLGLGAPYVAGPSVIEVNRTTGEHTFELAFDSSYVSYRAYKVP